MRPCVLVPVDGLQQKWSCGDQLPQALCRTATKSRFRRTCRFMGLGCIDIGDAYLYPINPHGIPVYVCAVARVATDVTPNFHPAGTRVRRS